MCDNAMMCPNCSTIIYYSKEDDDYYEKRELRMHLHRCEKDRCEYIIENEQGYQSIKMYNGANTYWRSLHKVVMELHLTKINGRRTVIHPSLQIHHKNGNKRDNRISNMKIVGAREHKHIHNTITEKKKKRLITKWNEIDTWIKSRENDLLAIQ